VAAALAAACGKEVNLTQALEVADALTGWYDAGPSPCAGSSDPAPVCSKLLPSLIFRLKNKSDQELNRIELQVQYWREGEDGPYDEALITGIGPEGLKPGASTGAIVTRGPHGFTLAGARADFFSHSLYKDATIKLLAKRFGEFYRIGEFKVDRRILPTVTSH
jgi:hypothetical protein